MIAIFPEIIKCVSNGNFEEICELLIKYYGKSSSEEIINIDVETIKDKNAIKLPVSNGILVQDGSFPVKILYALQTKDNPIKATPVAIGMIIQNSDLLNICFKAISSMFVLSFIIFF